MLHQASSAAASSTAHQLQWHRCVTCVHSRVGAAPLHIARRRVGNPCRVAMNEASAAAAEPAAASLPEEEAIEQPRPVSSLPWVRASPAQAAQLDEAEVERRRKISEANSGRVPWNKGRKHSPETIAKIKARTEEAMKRPETAANFKRAMEERQQTHSPETRAKIGARVKAYLEEKRIREGLPPKPEKPPKKERKPRKEDSADGAKADGSEASTSGASAASAGKKRRSTKAKAGADGEEGEVQERKEPKKRLSNSDQHKQAIRDAIKAKWQDPEYREYMCQRMKEAAQRKAAASGTTKSRSSGSNSGGSGSSNGNLAQTKQVWLQSVQALVAHLIKMQETLDAMDKQVAEVKAKAGAFANDPIMLGKMQAMVQQVESNRQEVAARVAEQRAKIPANVGYDKQGRVFLRQEPAQDEPSQ